MPKLFYDINTWYVKAVYLLVVICFAYIMSVFTDWLTKIANYAVSYTHLAGVAWTDDYKNAKYELIHEYKELYRITQTKYFQPEMSEIFVQIKEKLDKGSKVLFIGTSCSNAGLKSFLNREYNNLYCCDFVCRGYTSQLYHQKRVQELESAKGSKVKGIFYKNKSIGWEQFGTKFDFENGESYYVNRYDDPYEYMLQINDYVTRTSCFECKYRGSHRITDITVGDFWGIKGLPKAVSYTHLLRIEFLCSLQEA